MEVRDGETVKTQVEQASSRILEMMEIKGKVTDVGAVTVRCAEYDSDEEVYRVRHPWSVYQVPVSDMENAMDRLRSGLPKEGWEIVKDGVDGSPAKSPQIVAESKGQEYAVDVRLLDERKYSDDPSLIEVTVQSACYRVN
ncbi:hypothetical protein JL475_35105 [Streptomyces sp. M2CJ-2]|uniref:hypothetical protein n=1 Tax=Streptomyces sp. M2CJ-2 TaxID=2803948 RepID=UPI00192889B4|nr:hypothetical protein [Streptomyces sp. M2CJ-2]MBL3671076.1 hypothetical protein [Streptomyces sp. M2CJ-2]